MQRFNAPPKSSTTWPNGVHPLPWLGVFFASPKHTKNCQLKWPWPNESLLDARMIGVFLQLKTQNSVPIVYVHHGLMSEHLFSREKHDVNTYTTPIHEHVRETHDLIGFEIDKIKTDTL